MECSTSAALRQHGALQPGHDVVVSDVGRRHLGATADESEMEALSEQLRSLEAAATSTIIGIKVKHAKILSTIEETDAQRLAEAVRVCVWTQNVIYGVGNHL